MAQSNALNEFPADDEMPVVFPEFDEGWEVVNRKAITWSDVSMYIYFKVLSVRKVTRRNGGGMATIITLQRRSGNTFETWATRH